MSKRCPNCHADVFGDKCPSCSYSITPSWECPDCGTIYYCVGQLVSCPKCADAKTRLDKEYWDNKRVGLRSISNDIVAKILEN